MAERYPAGSIRTDELADAALADVARERSSVEVRHLQEVQSCQTRFFATSCIDDAHDRRRLALQSLRAVEIEANEFKRRNRVIQRDKALAEKRMKELERRKENEANRKESIKMDAAPVSEGPVLDKPNEAARKRHQAKPADRQAQHEAKLRIIRERDAAEARTRAQNVAAYERKVREAHERQLEIARRKAGKEQKRGEQVAEPASTR